MHVPYRGTAPAVTDVLGGQVEMIMTGVPVVQQHVKSGKLRALGVSSRVAVAVMSGVPTIAAPDSPTAFGVLITNEIARWKPVIERANMRPE